MIAHNSPSSGLERMNRKWAALVAIHYSLSTTLLHVNNVCTDTAEPSFPLSSSHTQLSSHLIHDRQPSSQEPVNIQQNTLSSGCIWCQTVTGIWFDINVSVKKKKTRAPSCSRSSRPVMGCKRKITTCADNSQWADDISHRTRERPWCISRQASECMCAAEMTGDNHSFYMHHRRVTHSRTPAAFGIN